MKFFSPPKENQNMFLWIGIGVTVIFLFLIGVTWYSTRVSHSQGGYGANLTAGAEGAEEQMPYLDTSNQDAQVGAIVARVAKHILMPEGEITVSTVTDAEGLQKNNPFVFQYVKNGDKILWHSGGFIIYDPAVDRVVDIFRGSFPPKQ